MKIDKRTESTIKYVVPNLRARWKTELAQYSDYQVARAYEEFSLSDEFGDNDEKFPLWFEIAGEYNEDDT